MWDRKILKMRGKAAFKANYWRCVLMALVLFLLVGGLSGNVGFHYGRQMARNDSTGGYENSYDWNDDIDAFEEYDDIDDIGITDDFSDEDFNDEDVNDLIEEYREDAGNTGIAAGLLTGAILLMVLIFTVIAFVADILVLNPFEVGCRKFFLDNSEGRGDVGDLAYAFKTNYGNIIKTCFFRDLFIFLWSLLFVIPGIIKTYEYRMVSYLLAENPDMDRKEALETSKQMMNGNKWDAFVLDLSFIGWALLVGCTFGILGIFYVNPYVFATQAELYNVLSGRHSAFGEYLAEQNNDANDDVVEVAVEDIKQFI